MCHLVWEDVGKVSPRCSCRLSRNVCCDFVWGYKWIRFFRNSETEEADFLFLCCCCFLFLPTTAFYWVTVRRPPGRGRGREKGWGGDLLWIDTSRLNLTQRSGRERWWWSQSTHPSRNFSRRWEGERKSQKSSCLYFHPSLCTGRFVYRKSSLCSFWYLTNVFVESTLAVITTRNVHYLSESVALFRFSICSPMIND